MRENQNQSKLLEIEQILSSFEAEHGFTILYAAEAGSRCWGMHSEDSDYDVRFVFIYPDHHYLQLDEPKDYVGNITKYSAMHGQPIDASGWDIRKSLRLLRKSNASLVEWLMSPIRYRDWHLRFRDEVLRSVRTHLGLGRLAHHYLGLAQGHTKSYLDPEHKDQSLKKVLYTIRCFLAARYILDRREMPPVNFVELTFEVATPISKWARQLITMKQSGSEIDTIPTASVGDLFHIDYHLLHNRARRILDQVYPQAELERLFAYSRWAVTQIPIGEMT